MKKLILLAVSLFLSFNLTVASTTNKNPFASAKTFKGMVVPLITSTIKYGFNDSYRGIIVHTAAEGTIFQGPTFNEKGEEVKPGDVLIKLNKGYRKAAVKAQKALVLEAEANMNLQKSNFMRSRKLIITSSVSTQDFQQAEADYYNALGQLEEARANLVETISLLELCTYRAQFTGIVDKVLFPAGLCAGELDVMQVSQLFPIGIKIKMPRDLVNKITISTPVTIHTPLSDKALGVGHGFRTLTEDGIRFIADNPTLMHKHNGKDILNVHSIHTVLTINYVGGNSKKILSVEKTAIKKDAKGYFVWKAIGQKNYVPGKGIDKIIKVQKVYVVPGKDIKSLQAGIDFISLKDAGSLQMLDVTISDIPNNFKDGSEVYCALHRYLFMPGDPVTVTIGPESK
jgi:hypothetical protein